MSQNKRSEFVALDGEGITVDKGLHAYTLLSASDESYIEDYTGLPTYRCLEYLLSLRGDHKIFVGFAFGYDVTMILRDLDAYERRMLASTNVVYVKLSNGFAYRIEHRDGKFFRVSWGVRFFSQKHGRMHWVTLCNKTITIYDTWGFFQSSFVKALIEWNVGADEIAEITRMKTLRSDFSSVDPNEIRAYNFAECRLLVQLMNALRDRLESLGIHLTHWYGAGAIASAILKKEGVKKYFPSTKQDCVMGSYFGGRIQAVQLGTFENVYTYDIRSAYPHIMRMMPAFEDTEPEQVNELGQWDIGLCRIRSQTPFGLLPYRMADDSIQFYSDSYGYYHASEIRASIALGAEVDLIEIWRLPHDPTLRPFAFIESYYAERAKLRAKGDYAHICVKLGLNSLYGKCAQRVGGYGSKPTYQSFWVAGAITAGCRAMLLSAASQDPESIIMFATDGIASTRPLPLPQGTELGLWEESEIDELRIYQPGMYYIRKGDKIAVKTRSVPMRNLDWDALKTSWDVDGIDGSVEVAVEQFVTYRRNLHDHPHASWFTMKKKLGFDPTKGIATSRRGKMIRLQPEPNPTGDTLSALHSVE